MFNWQQKDWPRFTYEIQGIEAELIAFAERTGRITGLLNGLPEKSQLDIIISTMVAEAVKTSEIEGEYISRQDVMSSVRNNLGLNKKPEKIKDKRVSGITELMLDVRNTFAEPLSQQKLFNWHQLLMKGNQYIQAGKWRTGEEPMQIISGALGKEKIHFEAPPSKKVHKEMQDFIKWFNNTGPDGKSHILHAPVRSAIAHLYFESIHPFEDGNGRIGRAISEKALSQNVGRPLVLSLSKIIESDKNAYYNALKKGQRSNEVTDWISYFTNVILEAQKNAEEQIRLVLNKARFFDRYGSEMNDRQLKVVRKMLEQENDDFEGGMNARKYVSITSVSKATATRDLQDLADKGIFIPIGSGRSTSYRVNIE